MNVRRAPWQAGRRGAAQIAPAAGQAPGGAAGGGGRRGFGPRQGPEGKAAGRPAHCTGTGRPASARRIRPFRRRACARPNRALYLDGQAARA